MICRAMTLPPYMELPLVRTEDLCDFCFTGFPMNNINLIGKNLSLLVWNARGMQTHRLECQTWLMLKDLV